MNKIKFEKIEAYKNIDFDLPERKTKFSAGYDFAVPEDITIPSYFKQLFKMVKNRITSDDMIEALALSGLIEDITKNGDTILLKSPQEQQAYLAGLFAYKGEVLEILDKIFTLTLNDVKKLTKEADAKATLIPTGVKAKIADNHRLELMMRSSTPFHSMMIMGNGVGLIDSDYYNNEDNEGHIFFQVINLSPFDIQLKKGEIIGQGVISEFITTTDDDADGVRRGGVGSTSKTKEVN